jgi:hypothetical protein
MHADPLQVRLRGKYYRGRENRRSSGDNRLFGEIAIGEGFINDKAIKAYLDSRK